jgi:dTDP-4-amino-4,6-dideoxygalactose transaminase
MVPYEDLALVNKPFSAAFRQQFEHILQKGWFILGEEVRRFEEDFAAYHSQHSLHCIGVANGLDALVLSLKAMNFPPGSEVIVPSNTYIATILAVLHCNLTPVLVEPDITNYNIDASLIRPAITSKTKAVLVVHLYGKCCSMDEIQSVCDENGLALFEDCAQSHGAKYKGRLCGTFGKAAAFSFYPTKNLGCLGDGGAVLTANDEVAALVKSLRNYGSSRKYYNDQIGYNSRLDELQAAFLQVKLKGLDEITAHKRMLAGIYINNLKNDFIKPIVHDNYEDVYHIFTVRHPRRDALRGHLKKHEIGTEIHYPLPPHRQKALQELFAGKDFPVSEEIHNTILSLPCSTAHNKEDVYKVIEIMNAF